MTFLAFRPFRRRKHKNDVIVTSYIKILQILKLKSKDITSKTLHAKFYASRIKNKRIRRGVKYAPPQVWSVFKSPGKIGLKSQTLNISQNKLYIRNLQILYFKMIHNMFMFFEMPKVSKILQKNRK